MIKAIALRHGGGAVRLLARHSVPAAFVLLLLGAAAPIFASRVPPLADYVNHLARIHVLSAIEGDDVLSRLYQVRWAVIPNLVMDVLLPPVARLLDIYLAGQIFVCLTVVVLVTGPMAVHRALFGRLSAWPLVAFPVVYNGIFLFGLMNYLLGLGIALWGVAAWIAMRERSAWLRGASSAAVVLLLFFCHLFAVGLYGLALMSIELVRFSRRRLGRSDLAAFLVPFLPVPALMAASPTLGLSSQVMWEARGKVDGLFTVVQLYGDVADLAFAGLAIAALTWLARRGLVRLHPAGWVLLTAGTMVYLAMPRVLFGSWLADQRLPVGLVFLLIGFAHAAPGRQSYRPAFLAVLIGISALRYADVQLHWQGLNRSNDDMRQAMALMEPGSALLVAHADHPAGSEPLNEALNHSPAMAVIERHALVSTLFTVPGKQVLDVRSEYRALVDSEDGDPPTVSQMLAASDGTVAGNPHYWDNWPGRYDYVAILHTHPGDANPDEDLLSPLAHGQGFQIYRVKRD